MLMLKAGFGYPHNRSQFESAKSQCFGYYSRKRLSIRLFQMATPEIVFSRRLRQTPFERRARAFTIYNHMALPSVFESVAADYAHLCEFVQLWDVAAERQVEVVGSDAMALIELVTPRDIAKCEMGRCVYAPLVHQHGGIEIYLQDSSKGEALWDLLWQAGERFNIRAGCPNLIDRLETGLLSYGNDMTLENNPFECGLDRFFKLGKAAEYMSRAALNQICSQGVARKLAHLKLDGDIITAPRTTFDVLDDNSNKVGILTSIAYSPKFEANLAFATVATAASAIGTALQVVTNHGIRPSVVCAAGWHSL